VDRLDLLFAAIAVLAIAVPGLAELARRQINGINRRLDRIDAGLERTISQTSAAFDGLAQLETRYSRILGAEHTRLNAVDTEVASIKRMIEDELRTLRSLADDERQRADRHDDQIRSVLMGLSALQRGELEFSDEFYRLEGQEPT
jgi:hypothetical protein